MNRFKGHRIRTAALIALVGMVAAIGMLDAGDPRADVADRGAAADLSWPAAPALAAAITSPFGSVSAASATVLSRANEPSAPDVEDSPGRDTSQDEHIEESRRKYQAFLDRPDGYWKYEALAAVHPEDIAGLDKSVHDRLLAYHGRLAVEELQHEVRMHPYDHAGNSQRYGRMLDIIAKAPCAPDEHWDDCIGQTLGAGRTDVEQAKADADAVSDLIAASDRSPSR